MGCVRTTHHILRRWWNRRTLLISGICRRRGVCAQNPFRTSARSSSARKKRLTASSCKQRASNSSRSRSIRQSAPSAACSKFCAWHPQKRADLVQSNSCASTKARRRFRLGRLRRRRRSEKRRRQENPHRDHQPRRHPRQSESIPAALHNKSLLPVRANRGLRQRLASRQARHHRLPGAIGHSCGSRRAAKPPQGSASTHCFRAHWRSPAHRSAHKPSTKPSSR